MRQDRVSINAYLLTTITNVFHIIPFYYSFESKLYPNSLLFYAAANNFYECSYEPCCLYSGTHHAYHVATSNSLLQYY